MPCLKRSLPQSMLPASNPFLGIAEESLPKPFWTYFDIMSPSINQRKGGEWGVQASYWGGCDPTEIIHNRHGASTGPWEQHRLVLELPPTKRIHSRPSLQGPREKHLQCLLGV